MEKEKAKKAIQKGNMEGARIHAENAIRQKNQALNYLRMSARVDAVSSRVQTALTTRKVILLKITICLLLMSNGWVNTTTITIQHLNNHSILLCISVI